MTKNERNNVVAHIFYKAEELFAALSDARVVGAFDNPADGARAIPLDDFVRDIIEHRLDNLRKYDPREWRPYVVAEKRLRDAGFTECVCPEDDDD